MRTRRHMDVPDGFRKCNKCLKIKELTIDNFYLKKKSRSGFHTYCIECCNRMSREWNKQHPEKMKSASRRWRASNPEKARQKAREWKEKNREIYREKTKLYKRRFRARYPEKPNAHLKVHLAQKKGTLKKSCCLFCKATGPSVQAHHEDYQKPLEVIWMCRTCHNKYHQGYKFVPEGN